MLMLNVKAEIQAVDHFGDVASWLDNELAREMAIGVMWGDGLSSA